MACKYVQGISFCTHKTVAGWHIIYNLNPNPFTINLLKYTDNDTVVLLFMHHFIMPLIINCWYEKRVYNIGTHA